MTLTTDHIDALRRECARIEEDCLYSSKGHYESAAIWTRYQLALGLAATVVAALAGYKGFSASPQIAGALALFSGALTAVLTFLKPGERAAIHQKSGSLYNSLKNRARVFREIELLDAKNYAPAMKRLRSLSDARNALNESSPEIVGPAFRAARKGVEAGEARYEADSRT